MSRHTRPPISPGLMLASHVERRMFRARNETVLLDSDLAELYRVSTKALVQAVKRNPARFPLDFMFRLTKDEDASLRSQIVTSNKGRGGRRHLPYVFTEQGVAMLSSVLRSAYAAQVNVEIMRVFVRLRRLLAAHSDLARKLADLEQKCDTKFRSVFLAIRELARVPAAPPRRRIGFRVSSGGGAGLAAGGGAITREVAAAALPGRPRSVNRAVSRRGRA